MSFRRGERTVDTLYVGLQKRTIPLPGQVEPQGMIFTISKDQKEVYGCPYVTLNVGTTYRFVIDTPKHPFYITTDSEGGGVLRKPLQSLVGVIEIVPETTGEEGNVGIEKGILTWTPSIEHAQMKLFYQCNFYPSMGNSIWVKAGE